MLGSLVRAAEACRDVAVAFGTPFISGKDSLNNTYAGKDGERLDIPQTLLISALGRVPDVRKCVTMDLKEAGQRPVPRRRRRRTSWAARTTTWSPGRPAGACRRSISQLAPKVFAAVHAAISAGLVRACHDLSEGGLAVALAEMAFAGGIGADVTDAAGRRSAATRRGCSANRRRGSWSR